MFPIEFFWRSVQRNPDRIAVIHPGGTLDFRTLAARVLRCAGRLVTLDPGLGSFVLVGAGDSLDHLVTILGVLAAGKVWIPLNPRNGDPELERIVEFVGGGLVMADHAMALRLAGCGRPVHPIGEDRSGEDAIGSVPMGPTPRLAIPLDRPQAIKFTGGTTGAPKGVLQPLRTWNTNILNHLHHMRYTPDDRYLVAAALTHGTSTYMLPILASGGTIVFPATPRADGLLDAIAAHRATVFFAPPTLLLSLAEAQRRQPRDLASLRCVVYGGGPMRPEQIRDVQSILGPVVATCYGQTEASQMIAYLPPEEMTGDNLASVGRPTFMTQVTIAGPGGTVLGPGETGEIAVRGDLVMSGYFRAEEETRRVFADGWLRTGDSGRLDERGYLFLGDRIRDVIITGGFNVYPSDVETVLARYPAVLDAAVVGVPDAKWGEAVHAAVQLRAGHSLDAPDLLAFVKRDLGSVKTPKELHVFAELPRSPVGKVLKSAIRTEILRRRAADGPACP
ncbi:MAG TPA: AMP-binding protein [Hyphomicrobiales bacterium]|nr:AMP-binding protein [Hyphomicrobiales bacterium]